MAIEKKNTNAEANTNANAEADDLDPYEIEFLPQFRQGCGADKPFKNQYGVIIGDHDYESAESPLEQWTEQTDPAVMVGEQWVHPYKDIGFQTAENRQYYEQGIAPQSGIFMHPDKNAAYDSATTPAAKALLAKAPLATAPAALANRTAPADPID